ncbi:unnamed protein product [Caenorhabditis auriculariae]|uniref:Domain of unknown function DB domain-containing protein n=1 Tax=Caenorhabditis auriculariae TaxID=2777116 RepID=A0A8S1HH92_9PELO|nr:unnamed protein product [Caenorhabditis auriculariae]
MQSFFAALCLAAVLAIGSAQSDSCDASSIQAITKCYQTYLSGYNFTMTDTLPEYWSFHNRRAQWLNDYGLHVQPQICLLGNTLVSCLQPYQCLGPNAYLQMNAFNLTQAQDYYIDLAVTTYQCGAGYNIGNQEFYCLAFCRERYQSDLDACSTQMQNTIAQGGNPCTATQQFLNCQSNIMKGCCDWNAGVYICNVDLVGVNAVSPQCSNAGLLSCPPPRTLAEMAAIAQAEIRAARHA